MSYSFRKSNRWKKKFMSQIKFVIIGLTISLPLVGCNRCNQQADNLQELTEAIIGKHTIVFTEPPTRIPNRNSVDAPLPVSYTHLKREKSYFATELQGMA